MILAACSALPRGPGFLAPVIRHDCTLHSPFGLHATMQANLTPASGRQDHTASPFATMPLVLHVVLHATLDRSRVAPPMRSHAHTTPSRPPHPTSTFGTTAI